MADWDSADCLRRFKDKAGLEDATELDDNIDIYPLIADGQEEAIREVAARYPFALYSAPQLMVPSGDRKTFKYPQVNGQDSMPMGWVQIAPRLTAFSGDLLFTGWVNGVEFMDEGVQIRIPGDRSYSGDLYFRGVMRPARVTAAVGISLLPLEIGVDLSINRAVRKWAMHGNQAPQLRQLMDEEWGMPKAPGAGIFATAMLTYKRRFRGGGGMIDPAQWYLQSPDLGGAGGR
jgi:hypothetical protein